MIAVAYCMICIVAGLMTVFVKFHIKLVSENITTIENLEREAKKQAGKEEDQYYDAGIIHNW